MNEGPTTAPSKAEPTLGTALSAVAAAQLPSRFYQLLNLAIPWGIQFALWGWYRSAGWMFAIGFFGIWALCQKRLHGPGSGGRYATVLRALRSISAVGAGLVASILTLEAFVQLMTILFNCPGCAG